MSNEPFVYVTYIAAKPEAVWSALTEPEFSRQYWGGELIPHDNWRVGSDWRLVPNDRKLPARHVGEVLEHVPGKRLVLSWADPEHKEDRTKRTRVAIEIAEVDHMVRLTITHDELYPEMRRKIAFGWPIVLSSLKSFLETGRSLRS